jgi:uncharacterized protein YegL
MPHFLQPQVLWLAPLVLLGPAIVYAAWMRYLQMSTWGRRPAAVRNQTTKERRKFARKAFFLLLAITCGIAALARPSLPSRHTQYQAGKVDGIAMLDFSRSMAARDCRNKTRMQTAKENLHDEVLPAMTGNRMGVITFAGEANATVYLTKHHKPIYWLLEHELKISSAPGDGSALGKAFELAFRYFDVDSKPDREKLILLYSDGGADDKTDIATIAEGCRKRRIKLIVIGLGGTTPALIPTAELSEEDQRMSIGQFYKVGSEFATTAIDKQLLDSLAKAAGGTFLHIDRWQDFRLAEQTAEFEPQEVVEEDELFQIPACLFLLVLMAAALSVRSRSGKQNQP